MKKILEKKPVKTNWDELGLVVAVGDGVARITGLIFNFYWRLASAIY